MENSKQSNLKAMFDVNQCGYCNNPSVDAITTCRHYVHLNCLSYYYFYAKSCPTCKTELKIPGLKVLDINKCEICKNIYNLIQCNQCNIKHCLTCINTRNLNYQCCREIKYDLQNIYFQCPGCEYDRPCTDFTAITCRGHSLLCKMCWNASVEQKKCILGCEISFSGGYFSRCFVCKQVELKYFGDSVCPNNCDVCGPCVRQDILRGMIEIVKPSCVYCGEQCIQKLGPWQH